MYSVERRGFFFVVVKNGAAVEFFTSCNEALRFRDQKTGARG